MRYACVVNVMPGLPTRSPSCSTPFARTAGTALTYGLVVGCFGLYAKRVKRVGLRHYAGGSIFGVLVFDFLTGPIMSSVMFRIPFAVAFAGQIPFTIMHLASGFPLTIILVTVVDPELRKTLQAHLLETVHTVGVLFSRIYKM